MVLQMAPMPLSSRPGDEGIVFSDNGLVDALSYTGQKIDVTKIKQVAP